MGHVGCDTADMEIFALGSDMANFGLNIAAFKICSQNTFMKLLPVSHI